MCNIHPLMMMQLKVKQFFQIIHDIIGNNEINKCFYVDLDFKSESFPFKPLDTSHPSLIDTFLQNWNKQEHFDAFMQKRMNFFH